MPSYSSRYGKPLNPLEQRRVPGNLRPMYDRLAGVDPGLAGLRMRTMFHQQGNGSAPFGPGFGRQQMLQGQNYQPPASQFGPQMQGPVAGANYLFGQQQPTYGAISASPGQPTAPDGDPGYASAAGYGRRPRGQRMRVQPWWRRHNQQPPTAPRPIMIPY